MEQDSSCGEDESLGPKRSRLVRQVVQPKKFCPKEERIASLKKVTAILLKSETERTGDEVKILQDCPDAVEEVHERRRKRDEAKRRLEEFEDPQEQLDEKCQLLAQAIAQSQHLVVYTGAGISTAAKIPDYRGPNGIWTRLQQGKDIGDHDLSLAEPTFTHMALSELYKKNILKYVVSQNCDGLHLRSGLPRTALSELHGNMYIEVCKTCKPHKEYWRLFDVTESTARFSHKTYRKCYSCNGPLVDTIVHFGERGSLQWPLNWQGACKHAKRATTIVCLGSSLKVLKKYPWLWQMDKPAKKRPNLYIVNLQWTPKDESANIKINGRCDKVMELIMEKLGLVVTPYLRQKDPIYAHCSELHEMELHTTTQPFLPRQDCFDLSPAATCDNNKIKHETPTTSLPSPQNKFSIEGLLNNQESRTIQPLFPVFNPAIFGLLANYPDLLFYPFQTSLLYPGLHSIIAPPPQQQDPECSFCHKNFHSPICLFYESTKPIFTLQPLRFSKLEQKEKPNICLCCDYSTDEEDLVVEEQKNKIQAGWFGKGYKKCRRPKRKSI